MNTNIQYILEVYDNDNYESKVSKIKLFQTLKKLLKLTGINIAFLSALSLISGTVVSALNMTSKYNAGITDIIQNFHLTLLFFVVAGFGIAFIEHILMKFFPPEEHYKLISILGSKEQRKEIIKVFKQSHAVFSEYNLNKAHNTFILSNVKKAINDNNQTDKQTIFTIVKGMEEFKLYVKKLTHLSDDQREFILTAVDRNISTLKGIL